MGYIRKIVLVFVLVLGFNTFSQQDPHYTNYTYNKMVVNPGCVGSSGYSSLVLLTRTQWVGFSGTPDSQTLAYDTGVNWKGVGLGFNLINDKIGPSTEFSFDSNASYAIRFSKKARLALGLKFGVRHLSIDWDKINLYKKSDPNAINANKLLPTLGFGLYYYTDKFYLGFANPNFFQSTQVQTTNKDSAPSITEKSHLFALMGGVFDVSSDFNLKPSVLVKAVDGAPVSFDMSLNTLINRRFHGGISYRWEDAISAMLGIQIKNNFMLGYAFDLTTSNYSTYNYGTHEILLKYRFSKTRNIRSPRFF